MNPPIDIDQATEVFVRAFCFTKSFAHPYLPEKIGPLWRMKDGPGRREPRTVEWVGRGIDPAEAVSIIRQNGGQRHAVCSIRTMEEDEASIREGFKAEGYRLLTTEAFFVHALDEIPRAAKPLPIERVMDPELAYRLKKAARTRQILPEHLGRDDAPLRQYVALSGKTPVGWVRSISVAGCTWCSNLFVERAHRRRGIAAALMARMLREDKDHASKASVLLASHAGAKLYPKLGYEQIGVLLLFTPRGSDE